MNNSTYRFTLDLQKHQSQMSIAVFQFDTAVSLYISLTDGGKPYRIEDGSYAILFGKRPDGEAIAHNCSIHGNTEIVYEFEDTTACIAGIVDCQIRLFGANEKLITAPKFNIAVDERVVGDDDIPVEDGLLSAFDHIFFSENERIIAEEARASSEASRVSAEHDRTYAEASRAAAEMDRVSAEAQRAIALEQHNESMTAHSFILNLIEELQRGLGSGGDGLRLHDESPKSHQYILGLIEALQGRLDSGELANLIRLHNDDPMAHYGALIGSAGGSSLQIAHGEYSGDGGLKKTLTFDIVPEVILIVENAWPYSSSTVIQAILVRSSTSYIAYDGQNGNARVVPVEWGEKSVTWGFSSRPTFIYNGMTFNVASSEWHNGEGYTYNYVAFGDADDENVGGSEVEIAINFATNEEVTQVLERVYGENCDNLPDDGEEHLTRDDIATDDEVLNMLNGVFGFN